MNICRHLSKLAVVIGIFAASTLLHGQADAQTAGQATNLNIYKTVLDLQKRVLALQGVVAGVPSLAQPLTDILNDLAAIQTQLNALVDPAQENVRVTPPYISVGDAVSCAGVNVSGTTQTVRAQLIQLSGGMNLDSGAQAVPPGEAVSVGATPCATCYCKFTVVGGSRTAIRGDLLVLSPAVALPAE